MSNIWRKFRELIPSDPLQVGTVIAVNGNEATVQKLDGGVLSVRGTGYAVNSKVYFRAGLIESAAPNLTQVNIEI